MATKKAEMTPEEMEAKEQEEFNTGPLRVLTDSVKNNTQVITFLYRSLLIIMPMQKCKN